MRRPAHLAAFLVGVLSLPSVSRAQDPAKIVSEYIRAIGGAKAISKIQTVRMEGILTGNNGSESTPYTLITKAPNRYYEEIASKPEPLLYAYNGKSAWKKEGTSSPQTLLGKDGLQLEAAARYYNSHLLDYKKEKIALRFVDSESVRGHDAFHVEATWPSGVQRNIFFDKQTHLIVKESVPAESGAQEIFLDDYRAEDAIKLPHRIERHSGDSVQTIAIDRVELNGAAGERVFDFPRKSQVELPDLKTLFKEIDENQKAIDKIKENYAGTRVEDETEFDKSGKSTKHEVHEYTFFYLDGEEISTLVKKDGKALSADEQKKENEKTQKRIQEAQKKEAKKEAKEEKAKEQGKEEKDDEPGIELFLRVSQFVNPRRERFRGQDVLVFDFEPNPEYKAKKLSEKVVQKLAGVIWIDEKAHDVARLEGYFVGDMKIGGGLLANLQKGTSFVFEQAYLNNEVWLPTYEEAHVGVRVLLMKGFNVAVATRYSDYKRFNVESISTISQPKQTQESPKEEKPN